MGFSGELIMDKRHLPERIHGERIYLQKHSLELAPIMFAHVDKDRQRLQGYMPWVDLTQTVEDEIAYIKMTEDQWSDHEGYDYGIFRSNNDFYMGNIGVHTINWAHDKCEFGYWILGDFEGRGYMSEAVKLLESACFEIGFNRIEIRCSELNLRSANVPIRNGYRLEGCFREDAFELGKRRNTLIFAKLKNQKSESLSAFIGLDFVYLFVGDIEQSKKWYAKVFGQSPTVEMDNFVEFRPGGSSALCLHPADEKSPLATGGSVGYWKVVNLAATLRHFTENGATIYRGPLKIPDGTSICQIKDPFGNVIGMVGA